MKEQRTFEIAFVGLKDGIHHFKYPIDNAFFESYSPPEFEKSDLVVEVTMDKKERFFLFTFVIHGSVRVNCDRCGEPFDLSIWDEFPLVVKRVFDLNSVADDEDPNVIYVSQGDSVLNIKKWVYDFSLLSIPMQKIHPDDEDGNSTCDPAVLKILDEMREREEKKENPVWKGLEKFRNIEK